MWRKAPALPNLDSSGLRMANDRAAPTGRRPENRGIGSRQAWRCHVTSGAARQRRVQPTRITNHRSRNTNHDLLPTRITNHGSRSLRACRTISRFLYSGRSRSGSHSTRTGIAAGLEQPTRDSAARRRPWTRRVTAGPLFGLAPRGVYPATSIARGAVRSYRTISPLPRRRTGGAVSFLWHFP